MFAFYIRQNDPTGQTRPLPRLLMVAQDETRAKAELIADVCLAYLLYRRRYGPASPIPNAGMRITEFRIDGIAPPVCPYYVDSTTWTLRLLPGLSFVGFWEA